jgi:hypothetical protein
MKITVQKTTPFVKLRSLQTGQMGISKGPIFAGELFIRTYTGIIALDSTTRTGIDGIREWAWDKLPASLHDERISLLNPGDTVTIEIE